MKRKITAIILAAVMLISLAAGAMAEGHVIWEKGNTGDSVKWIQTRLIELEYMTGEATGVFDDETEDAVKWFQSDHWLLVTGMVDSVTWELLESATEHAAAYKDEDTALVGDEEFIYEAYMAPAATYMPIASNASFAASGSATEAGWWEPENFNTDEYSHFESNRFLSVATSPLSTFAADVDTSSYAQFRRRVLNGETVPADSVRVEEMINYFHYDYAQPADGEPFGVTVAYSDCPWNTKTRLLQIGLQAKSVPEEERPPYHLIFLIDTSGSMDGEDRLDLVKRAFLLLLDELTEKDTVSIVAYASEDRVVLEGVPATEKTRIMEAITGLEPHGSTNGTAGLIRAYDVADKYKKEGGITRILLATDGDLNVGASSEGELARLVTEKKKAGVALTCMGFGMGNYKDNKMEALADYGDGNCWYIDSIYEARRALVTEAGGTFITVAKDAKIQVDFNPAYIKGYRLIGYEDRLMAAEDFANDEKDGGEIGSGHRVTALYEVVPVESDFDIGQTSSRYQQGESSLMEKTDEIATVSVRAKEPEGNESKLYEYIVRPEIYTAEQDDNMRFAAAVAETAMLLRDSEWKGEASWDQVLELLRSCGSVTGDVYKEEFVYLATLLQRAGEINR